MAIKSWYSFPLFLPFQIGIDLDIIGTINLKVTLATRQYVIKKRIPIHAIILVIYIYI